MRFGSTRPADTFPSDDVGYGFDNIGDVLSISPLLMEKYLAAAEQVARAVILTPETAGETAARLDPVPGATLRHAHSSGDGPGSHTSRKLVASSPAAHTTSTGRSTRKSQARSEWAERKNCCTRFSSTGLQEQRRTPFSIHKLRPAYHRKSARM